MCSFEKWSFLHVFLKLFVLCSSPVWFSHVFAFFFFFFFSLPKESLLRSSSWSISPFTRSASTVPTRKPIDFFTSLLKTPVEGQSAGCVQPLISFLLDPTWLVVSTVLEKPIYPPLHILCMPCTRDTCTLLGVRMLHMWNSTHKDTWNLGGERERKDPQQVPHDARTPTTKETATKECFFDFGRERSTTRIGGQRLHLHESPTKDNRRDKRKDWRKGWNERENEEEDRERTGTGIWGQGGVGTELLVLHLWPWQLPRQRLREPISAHRVQILHPALDGACTQCVRHTEPRKTCSRVRGFCNSAIMKRLCNRAPGKTASLHILWIRFFSKCCSNGSRRHFCFYVPIHFENRTQFCFLVLGIITSQRMRWTLMDHSHTRQV